MSKTERIRVDYMPGPAALEALQAAKSLHPDHNTQALIDRLVITGLVALTWQSPALYGRDRDRWELPDELRAPVRGDDG